MSWWRIISRIIIDVLLFTSALVLPWWITMLVIAALSLIFPFYFEGVAVAFAIDSLYGSPVRRFLGFEFSMTIAALAFLSLGEYLKTRLAKRE